MIDYRIVNGKACYWIQTDKDSKIINAAPIARRWIGKDLRLFISKHPGMALDKLNVNKGLEVDDDRG